MRDIIFRGKRVDNGEWVEGFLSKGRLRGYKGNTLQPCIDHEEEGVMLSSVVMPSTVGQCTGMTDKNGKKIFESDIIELVNADHETIHVVCEFGTARRQIFDNVVDIVGFYFKLPNGKKSFPIVSNYAGKHDLELFEIVGNIYENPGLLDTHSA